MVDIVDTPASFVPVTRVEVSDLALGGNEVNVPNKQLKELARRDKWLQGQIETLQGGSDTTAQQSFADFKLVGMAGFAQGRLTLETGVSVPANPVSGSTLYYTPDVGNRVALWNNTNSRWDIFQFTERSLSLAGLAANTNYDVFLFNNSGTLTMETVAWSNSGAGTSTRATSITLKDGAWVKSTDNRRYLGTIRTTGTTGQCEDSDDKRFVWNVTNQISRRLKQSSVVSYTYNSTTVRAANGNTALRLQIVVGLPNRFLQMSAGCQLTSGDLRLLLGVNSTTTETATDIGTSLPVNTSGNITGVSWQHALNPPLGYQFYQILEALENSGSATSAAVANPTIQGFWDC